MTTKWKVTGRYEWTEERHFDCIAYIDAMVEADTEAAAVEKAIKAIDGDADEEDESYSDRNAWRHGSRKNIKVQLSETDDDELRQKVDALRNLEFMRMYSTPLIQEVQS